MKKLFVFLLLGVFLISFASAFEFDNVKDNQATTWDGKNVNGNELLEKYTPIKITNAFGLGSIIFEGYLSQHDESCGIDCSSIMEINLHEERPLIDSVDFYTINEDESKSKQDVRSYQFYIKTDENEYSVDDYEWQCVPNGFSPNGTAIQDCSNVKVGSHIETESLWEEYTLETTMPKGEYTVKLDAKKKPSRTVDWVIQTSGETLNEWAVWGPSPNLTQAHGVTLTSTAGQTSGYGSLITMGSTDAILSSVRLNESVLSQWVQVYFENGTLIDNVSVSSLVAIFNTPIVLDANRAYRFESSGTTGGNPRVFQAGSYPVSNTYLEWTTGSNLEGTGNDTSWNNIISINITFGGSEDITLIAPDNLNVTNNPNILFNATSTHSTALINSSLFHNGLGNWARNATNSSALTNNVTTFNQIFGEGNYVWAIEMCDIEGDCSISENRTFTIDTTSPVIEIENPIGTLDYNFIGGNETLNVTFTDTTLDSCWYDYNGTNITIEGCISGTKNSAQFILQANNFNMTLYANDSFGNSNTTFINWSYTYLENNRTLNNESFETESESFNINVIGPTTVTLVYNDTEYTTTKSGDNFNRTIQIPVGQLGNNLIHWRFDDTQDSFDSFQNISETVFILCNPTYTTNFLNISFKDEESLTVINASIPTSTFEYWLGDGTVTKTLTFINNTNNFNYEFCATPNRIFNFNSLIQYKQGTAYPQRVFSQDSGSLTNTTTDLILYLLGVSDGLFVTFQVLNVAEQPISGVDISATRVLEGSDTPVAQGTTDAAGSVTFWLNPDFQHTLTFSKTGLDTETLTIFPTQTAYTISMGGGTVTEPDQTRGVSLTVRPQIAFLFNDTTYNFNYTISSEFWNLEQFGYTLIYSNGSAIDTQLSTATSGGTLSTIANTFNLSWIRMDYHYLINTTFTNASRVWYIQNTEGTEYSISNFFERLTFYIDAGMFGFDDFGKALISFLILVLVAGGLSFRYGINSEVAIMGIIFGVVLVLDVGLGLIPNPQLATQAGIENIVTVITGILLFGILVKEELR